MLCCLAITMGAYGFSLSLDTMRMSPLILYPFYSCCRCPLRGCTRSMTPPTQSPRTPKSAREGRALGDVPGDTARHTRGGRRGRPSRAVCRTAPMATRRRPSAGRRAPPRRDMAQGRVDRHPLRGEVADQPQPYFPLGGRRVHPPGDGMSDAGAGVPRLAHAAV
jgi:hypothetical protein